MTGTAVSPHLRARSHVRPTSLRVSATWLFVGRTIYNICQFGILAVLAQLGSASDVGAFVYGLSVTAPIVMFCNMQLRLVLATDVRGEYSFNEYLMLRNLMSGIAMTAILLAALLTSDGWQIFFVIFAVGFSKCVESLSDIHYGRMQRCHAIPAIARSLLLRGPSAVICALVFFLITHSVVIVSVALAISWLIVLIAHDLPASATVGDYEPRTSTTNLPNIQRLAGLCWKTLPLGIGTGLHSLEANVPRYVTAYFFDAELLGIVGTLTYALPIGQMIVLSICYPAIPRLAKNYAESQIVPFCKLLWKLCVFGLLVGTFAFLTALFTGHQILLAVFGLEYAAQWPLLLLLAAAGGVQLVHHTLLSALRAMRRFHTVSLMQAASLAVTTCLCIVLTRLNGLTGLGWAILCSSMFHGAVSAFVVLKQIRHLHLLNKALPSNHSSPHTLAETSIIA